MHERDEREKEKERKRERERNFAKEKLLLFSSELCVC
jgi:hypothetical protein